MRFDCFMAVGSFMGNVGPSVCPRVGSGSWKFRNPVCAVEKLGIKASRPWRKDWFFIAGMGMMWIAIEFFSERDRGKLWTALFP